MSLTAAVTRADTFWSLPCPDNIVWTADRAIDVAAEVGKQKKKAPKTDWVPVFLWYAHEAGGRQEGLYLIPAADKDKRAGAKFLASAFPDRVMLSSWSDKRETTVEGQTGAARPPYWGLNDCTHFISNCLAAAGKNVETPRAAELVAKLRARSDIKTLCLLAELDAAKRIIDSPVLRAGDVIAFGGTNGHHRHTTLVVRVKTTTTDPKTGVETTTGVKVAMHTHMDHPDGGGGDWEPIVDTGEHARVTVLHFSDEDVVPGPFSALPGWWRATKGGKDVFYHFDKTGHVAQVAARPKNLKLPPGHATARGYWFEDPGNVRLCWTASGTFEALVPDLPDRITMAGTSDGATPMTMARL